MCGNGSRCIGKYVYDKGLTDKTEVTLETLAGIKTLKLHVSDGKVGSVTVDMGKAEFLCKNIPAVYDEPQMIDKPVERFGKVWKETAVSMGNPHCVIFTEDDIKALELEKIGPEFENDPAFPERVNTEFVNIVDGHTFSMRVWERGSGETMACGTGACAAAAAAVRKGLAKAGEEITVKLLGGDLGIVISEDYNVMMTGPAEIAFEGTVEI